MVRRQWRGAAAAPRAQANVPVGRWSAGRGETIGPRSGPVSSAPYVSSRRRTMAAPFDVFPVPITRGHDRAASRARGSKMAAGEGATDCLTEGG